MAGNADAAGNNVGTKSKIDLDDIPCFMKNKLKEMQQQLDQVHESYNFSLVEKFAIIGLPSLIILRSVMDSMRDAAGKTKIQKLISALKGFYPHRVIRDGILKSLIFNGNKKRKLISAGLWTSVIILYCGFYNFKKHNKATRKKISNQAKKDLELKVRIFHERVDIAERLTTEELGTEEFTLMEDSINESHRALSTYFTKEEQSEINKWILRKFKKEFEKMYE